MLSAATWPVKFVSGLSTYEATAELDRFRSRRLDEEGRLTLAMGGHPRYATTMDSKPALRRLVDLPGVDDLEYKALMKRDFAEPEARAEFPEIDQCSLALFGLTADQAEAIPRPADWDGIEHAPIAQQVAAFEAAGWDVTDNKRRPLRILGHFNQQLWLAVRGVAGQLPFQPDDDKPASWVKGLEAEAARFRRR